MTAVFPSADYDRHQSAGFGGHGSPFPFEMNPPFASDSHLAGRSHRLNGLSDHRQYEHGGKYAPSYRYQRPQHYPEPVYSAPVYVPRGHPEPQPSHGPGPDPFLAVHQRVNAQFESEHRPPPPAVRYPPPPPAVHLVPLQPVYHSPPPPPPPAYHEPAPYAHKFPYSEHEPKEHPASRRPHAKALDTLNPAPFIAAIASAYKENEKNFGVQRQGRLEDTVYHGPEHPRQHPVFGEHPLFEPAAPRHPAPVRPHGAPYLELGPLYALATAGSEVSPVAVPAGRSAETDDGTGAAQEA